MFKFEETVLNREGQPIAGASVTMFQAGTSTQAVIYEDDQTTLKTNPLTTDTNGFVQCKAANGKYDFEISIGGVLFRRVNGIIFDDPSESGSTGVSLSMPTAEFAVTGSPGSALAVDKKNQNANTVWAGPSAGSPNKPGFRAIVAEDLPMATEAQSVAGTSTSTTMSPAVTGKHPAAVKAYANFNGISGSVGIRKGYNVSSVVRNGTGDYTINFTNPMPDLNYTVSVTGNNSSGGGGSNGVIGAELVTSGPGFVRTLTSVRVHFYTLAASFPNGDVFSGNVTVI